MSIGPVHWGSQPGETLEKVMAVMLSQEDPTIIRRTPSSGDGGVDILAREEGGWHVRQVKGFVGRMDAGRRKQVEESFSQVLSDPRLEQPVKRWSLTVPIDPTSGEQRWFDDMKSDVPFPCQWEGETYWHGMAAKYPHVIDYYLRDGRLRVEKRSDTLIQAARAPAGPLTAVDVSDHLERLRVCLNRDDPHYRYEFMTGMELPGPGNSPPGAVMALTRSTADGQMLTILVFARHRYATEDAPIQGRFRITVLDSDHGIDIREAFEHFRTFGTALDLPEGVLDVQLSAPGGLEADVKGAAGRVSAIPAPQPPERTRLRLTRPGNAMKSEVVLYTKLVTGGERGGLEVTSTDEAEAMKVMLRLWPRTSGQPGDLTFHATLGELHGKPVNRVLPAIQFLSGLAPPNELKWLMEHGTRVLASYPFTEAAEIVPKWFVQFLEDLSLVQDQVADTVLIPSKVDEETVRTVATVARVLRNGEIRGTWTHLEVRLKEGVTLDSTNRTIAGPGALVVEATWVLELEGRSYDLGLMHRIFSTARLADEQPPDGESVRLVPDGDDTLIQRPGPKPEVVELDAILKGSRGEDVH